MRKILFTMLSLLLVTTVTAQSDMEIGKLFNGRFRGNKAVAETHIKGAKLERQHLDEYHSLTLTDPALTATVENAVLNDAKRAWKKEVSYIEGRLYFGFYTFYNPQAYRYVLYLNNRLKGKDTVTLIYMEGEADPQEVRKMLKKQ